MKRQSIILALTLVWGVCFANISNATIMRFETSVIVAAVPDPTGLGFAVGQELNDLLLLDFGSGFTITDISNIVLFLGDGGAPLTPVAVGLTLTNGLLSGFLEAMVDGLPGVFTRDDWINGSGDFIVTSGDPSPGMGLPIVLLAGSTVVRAVPEPATFALFGLGLAGLGWSRRKKA